MLQRIKKIKTQMQMKQNVDKVQGHFRKYKQFYIGLAVGVAVGAIAMFFLRQRAISNSVKIQGVFVNSPPTVNNEFNVTIYPRHNRSIAMRDPKTGIPYGSIRQASQESGHSANYVRKNFENLGEVA